MEYGGILHVPLHGETHENDMHGKAENQTWWVIWGTLERCPGHSQYSGDWPSSSSPTLPPPLHTLKPAVLLPATAEGQTADHRCTPTRPAGSVMMSSMERRLLCWRWVPMFLAGAPILLSFQGPSSFIAVCSWTLSDLPPKATTVRGTCPIQNPPAPLKPAWWPPSVRPAQLFLLSACLLLSQGSSP